MTTISSSKRAVSFALASVLMVSLAACAQPGQQGGVMQGGGINKQDAGTLLGGIAGGIAGNQVGKGTGRTVSIIAGSLLGAAIGNSVGASLDNADLAAYNQTSQRALEVGQPGQAFPWSNPQSGNSGVITPTKFYQQPSGEYCREYQQKITVGGKTQSGYGTACRQPDGSWQVVK